jgi:hypothetical protein
MEVFWWVQTAGAVFFGNMLTVGFLYFFWVSHQRQKDGLNPYDVGGWALLAGAVAPLLTLFGIWLLKIS